MLACYVFYLGLKHNKDSVHRCGNNTWAADNKRILTCPDNVRGAFIATYFTDTRGDIAARGHVYDIHIYGNNI